ncbi:hypothetical protein BaRGS_00039863 [Batillaria attramentaria]|uniref:NR LBD domain-containing protein n=1 Tax=Batillaria attramentaria TaxID=370345 RepID=A0ABD0J2J7_9CAEN
MERSVTGGGQKTCDITGDNRNICSFCRYQRCLSLGMSREAIKTGRYTHEKRTQDTLEVRMLKTASNQSSLPDHWTAEEVDGILSSLLQVGEVTNHLSTRHRSVEDILLLDMTSRDKFSPLKDPLPADLFSDVSRSLRQLPGMETDGFRVMADGYAKEVERLVRNFMRFSDSVPGFSQLCWGDQTALLRLSWLEVVLIGNTLTSGHASGFSHICNITCLNSSIIANVIGADVIQTLSAGEHRVRRLAVTSEELTLTQAVCLTFPDRCDLENRGQVEDVQWLLVRCLLHVLARNHGKAAGRKFSDLITNLTFLRDVSEEVEKSNINGLVSSKASDVIVI